MKQEQLIERLARHLVTNVAPRLTDPVKQFKIGLIAGGIGRRRIAEMAKPMLDEVTGENGEVDLASLRKAVGCGFEVAKELPVPELGIVFDAADAEAFFSSL